MPRRRRLPPDSNGSALAEYAKLKIFEVPIFNVGGGLTWDQSLHGWYGNNVDGTSLLVTVASPTTFPMHWDEVADESGLIQNTLSYAGQTTDPAASYPAVDLGIVTPGQPVDFTFEYHFAWGDGRTGIDTPSIYVETDALNPFVPEPGVLGLMSALGLTTIGFLRRRRALVLASVDGYGYGRTRHIRGILAPFH